MDAIVTDIKNWSRGDIKEFVLGSVKATPNTKISVLGQNDLVVEYKPNADAKSRFKQTDKGLEISVVRAQRIYNNAKWPNPIIVKIENVLPSLDPPIIETQKAKVSNKTVTLSGNLLKKGDAKKVKVGFEYRLYAGFVENISNKIWHETSFREASNEAEFTVVLENLQPGKTYEYRAVVVHPQMSIYGDVKKVTTKNE